MSAADLQFSSEHKAQFGALLQVGELHAINGHPENLDFGPWQVGSHISDFDSFVRLRSRFRAAARKAAMAAGAPHRANLQDWWIAKLARGEKVPSITGLLQRSVELCEEFESKYLELPPPPEDARGPRGLSRDRYPCDPPTPYFLYTDPDHRPLGDADEEFAYWRQFIWEHFNGNADFSGGIPSKRRRWTDDAGKKREETQEETRRHMRERVENRTSILDACMLGLCYDLAVLQANYVLDRALQGEVATSAFERESEAEVASVLVAWREKTRLFGLSWQKQQRRKIDFFKTFQEVGTDLSHLINRTPLSAERSVSNDVIIRPNGEYANTDETESRQFVESNAQGVEQQNGGSEETSDDGQPDKASPNAKLPRLPLRILESIMEIEQRTRTASANTVPRDFLFPFLILDVPKITEIMAASAIETFTIKLKFYESQEHPYDGCLEGIIRETIRATLLLIPYSFVGPRWSEIAGGIWDSLQRQLKAILDSAKTEPVGDYAGSTSECHDKSIGVRRQPAGLPVPEARNTAGRNIEASMVTSDHEAASAVDDGIAPLPKIEHADSHDLGREKLRNSTRTSQDPGASFGAEGSREVKGHRETRLSAFIKAHQGTTYADIKYSAQVPGVDDGAPGTEAGPKEPTTLKPPSPARWEDIEIRFTSEQRVQVFVCGKPSQTLNYADMDFEDRRGGGGKPTRAWSFLLEVAQRQGMYPADRVFGDQTIQKRAQEVRDRLEALFHVDGDPLPFVPGTGYKSRFSVRLSPSFTA